jgi:hypothetical protein
MIKNLIAKTLLVLLMSSSIISNQVMAQNTIKVNINGSSNTIELHSNTVDREEIFNYYAEFFRDQALASYKYIDLKYTDVEAGSKLYDSLQVLVFF